LILFSVLAARARGAPPIDLHLSSTANIIHGNTLAVLAGMAAGSVHCVVTSPPYWGLRDYGFEGQIGLEPTPEEFVAKLVAVFREIRRVLRADGTCWINMGDCYATGAGKVGNCPGGGERGARWRGDVDRVRDAKRGYRGSRNGHEGKHGYGEGGGGVGPITQPNRMPIVGLKPKDLVGIPWRLAFALQADGWWLRQDIIWSKPGVMPESVRDRCTKSHEYIFLLSKSRRYYFDADAISEPAATAADAPRNRWDREEGVPPGRTAQKRVGRSGNKERKPSSARGVPTHGESGTNGAVAGSVPWEGDRRNKRSVWTVATVPSAEDHFASYPPKLIEPCILAGCPVGGVVLDPFAGTGTTLAVAIKHGRRAIGIDGSAKYVAIAKRRVARALEEIALFHQGAQVEERVA